MIIDASDSVLGRVAAVVAKKTLLGEQVNVVNCDKAIITGSKSEVINRFKGHRARGIPAQGPYFPRQSFRIFKRTVRGMLPFKKTRGKEALKRVFCYAAVPEKFANQKFERVEGADIGKLTTAKFVYLHDIVKELGGKI